MFMWVIFAIIVIIIGIFFYIRIVSFIDYRKYYKEYEHIFNSHKEIGYPPLTEEQQFEILDNENWSYISNLTKYSFVPTGLLSKYINIDPDRYINHLRSLNLKDKFKFDAQNLQDGFFIKETDKGYEYFFVDRQKIAFRKKFSSYESLLKYITYHRLWVYAPEKYRFAWLKKYLA